MGERLICQASGGMVLVQKHGEVGSGVVRVFNGLGINGRGVGVHGRGLYGVRGLKMHDMHS